MKNEGCLSRRIEVGISLAHESLITGAVKKV